MSTTALASDVEHLANADLHAEVVRQERAARAHAAERLQLIAEVDRRRSYEDLAYLSTMAWLKDACGFSGAEARRWVELARRLVDLPQVSKALAQGDISLDHARLLAQAAVDHPERFDHDETMLIDTAHTLSPPLLRKALDYWRQALEPDAAEVEYEERFVRRRLHASVTLGGMVRVDGDLDPEGGAVVMAALRSLAEPAALDHSDSRTSSQRNADALVDICRDHLDSGDTPRLGGERPHVTLAVDLATLEARAGRTCELDDTGVITPQAARRLACDAGLSRVITKGQSEPLDVGRRTRTVPAATRRALAVRDGGCISDGCDRPPRWTDAHHLVHWADGGPTSLDNLVLLCRRHHRMAHGP